MVWAALGIVYVVWGSTYLGIAVVVKTMPPLLSAGVRFIVAALVMALIIGIAKGWRSLRISPPQIGAAVIVGGALLLGGNGLVMLAEQKIASGLAALIIAIEPLVVVVLRSINSERIGRGTLLGVVAGFLGVGLLLSGGLTGEFELIGVVMVVVAAISWSVGSYYSGSVPLPSDPFVSSAAQMLAGGILLTIVGVAAGELPDVQPANFAPESMLALVYLIVFGSIVAFSAYTWLLQHAPVSKVMTFAYVNPVIAIFLGWLILNEPVTAAILAGGALIVAAVAVVIRTESRTARREPVATPTPAPATVSPSRPA
jgi:drug/metabolite transporter (DMT)-like permease